MAAADGGPSRAEVVMVISGGRTVPTLYLSSWIFPTLDGQEDRYGAKVEIENVRSNS